MAVDNKPSTWADDWAVQTGAVTLVGNQITVPVASFPQMTAAEAHGTTGDFRKVLFALLDQFFDHYDGLAADDKPAKLRISKSASVNTSTNVITNQYVVTIYTDLLTQEVVDEPTP